jgi:mono/diheme cytochrome c family protein
MKTKLIMGTRSMALIFVSAFAMAAPPKLTPALLEKGKAAYTTNCMTCHGEKGDGNGVAGAMMNPKPRNFIADKFKQGDKPEKVFKTISQGLPNTSMVGFGHLSEEERWALTYYVLDFRKAGKK